MVKMRTILIACIVMIISCGSLSATDITDTHTMIVHPAFHTLQLKVNGDEQLPPIIMLGSSDRLLVSFDELSNDHRYMRYELLHCDSRWRIDRLVNSEYLDGFNEGLVEDYEFSQATSAHYVNYNITLPNEDMAPRLSGNYLVRVYDESTPDNTILQARFMVVDPVVSISSTITSRTDIDYNESHQQLTLGVEAKGVPINNLFNDLTLVVQQNGRHDNQAVIAHPTRIAGNTAWYEHDRNLIFPAGNEYRRMEIVSTSYPGMRVESMSYAYPYYHATLLVDEPRCEQSYIYDQTQFGRFRVREYNSDNSDVEAEYVVTHFALNMAEQHGYDIFIDGDMVQRLFNPTSRMVYNRASGLYECAMLLKQGAYNYRYLAVPHGSMVGYTSAVEGDFYQTVNEYLILVYYREPGARYDRLIGASIATSGI